MLILISVCKLVQLYLPTRSVRNCQTYAPAEEITYMIILGRGINVFYSMTPLPLHHQN